MLCCRQWYRFGILLYRGYPSPAVVIPAEITHPSHVAPRWGPIRRDDERNKAGMTRGICGKWNATKWLKIVKNEKFIFCKKQKSQKSVFFITSIIEKYADYRFVQNTQIRVHRAIPQIKTLAKKPRFFCNNFFHKNEKNFWRISGVF